jgi:hypothetical protein
MFGCQVFTVEEVVMGGDHTYATGEGCIWFTLPSVGGGITETYVEEGLRSVDGKRCEVVRVAEGGVKLREGCLPVVEASLSYLGSQLG